MTLPPWLWTMRECNGWVLLKKIVAVAASSSEAAPIHSPVFGASDHVVTAAVADAAMRAVTKIQPTVRISILRHQKIAVQAGCPRIGSTRASSPANKSHPG